MRHEKIHFNCPFVIFIPLIFQTRSTYLSSFRQFQLDCIYSLVCVTNNLMSAILSMLIICKLSSQVATKPIKYRFVKGKTKENLQPIEEISDGPIFILPYPTAPIDHVMGN